MKKKWLWKLKKKLNNGTLISWGKGIKQFAFICLTLIFFTVGCVSSNNNYSVYNGSKVFLLNDTENRIEGIDLELKEVIDHTKVNEIVDYVLMLLYKGVSSSNLKPTIEDDTLIQYYNVNGKNIIINFSSSYYDLTFEKEIFLRASVVKTLTSFDLIDSVEFFVSGIPLKLNSNKSLGRQYSGDVLVTYDEAMSREDIQSIIMYFPNKDLSSLVAEFTSVTITPNKKIEEIVVDKLLTAYNQVLPTDVKLLNVYTHEGICFVDFSSEFQTSLLPSGISERIAIYALVNSLTELANITNVQILVEGKKESTFQGTLLLNRIFTKNFSLIETDFGGD